MSREQFLTQRLAERGEEVERLREALRVADESIRHHLRGDQISAAMIQPHAVRAIREALDGRASPPVQSEIRPEDVMVEASRRHPGGQHVGIDPGVRVTHVFSGLTAECRTDRSQHRNKAIAMDMILGGLTSPHYR